MTLPPIIINLSNILNLVINPSAPLAIDNAVTPIAAVINVNISRGIWKSINSKEGEKTNIKGIIKLENAIRSAFQATAPGGASAIPAAV